MLPKKFRLPLDRFSRKRWLSLQSASFLLKFLDNRLGYNRFGIIISAKAERKSVKRNFWRRRFMERIKSWPNLSRDFLIIVSPKVKYMNLVKLEGELAATVRKLAGH